MTSTTADTYIESFPATTLTKIQEQPNYKTIEIVNYRLSANAASICTERSGNLDYLAMTIPMAVYNTLLPNFCSYHLHYQLHQS